MNYYRRYVGDYLRDTSRLSLLEHGAYTVLLDCYYTDEKPVPLDSEDVYRMVRAMRPDERRAVDRVLALFFTKGADGYHQKRADEEIAVAQATIAKQRASGAEAASKRWGEDGLTGRSTHESTHPADDGLTLGLTGGLPIQPLNHSTTQPLSRSGGAAKTRRRPKTPLPENFGLTERLIEWAKANGHENLQAHLDHFRLKAAAADYRYADWEAAFMGAVRDNWAKIAPKLTVVDKFAGAL